MKRWKNLMCNINLFHCTDGNLKIKNDNDICFQSPRTEYVGVFIICLIYNEFIMFYTKIFLNINLKKLISVLLNQHRKSTMLLARKRNCFSTYVERNKTLFSLIS